MDDAIRQQAPRWVGIGSAALVGWNIGVLTAFMVAIAIGIGANSLDLSLRGGSAIAVLGVATILSIATGIVVGRLVKPWFLRKTSGRGYAWLVVLVIITVISMPGPFVYVEG